MPLGWKIAGHELHTGGYFRRTELYGSIRNGLNSSHMYTANGRLVLDSVLRRFKVRWLGIGGSYYGGENMNGLVRLVRWDQRADAFMINYGMTLFSFVELSNMVRLPPVLRD